MFDMAAKFAKKGIEFNASEIIQFIAGGHLRLHLSGSDLQR
jgi:hypothetical protein